MNNTTESNQKQTPLPTNQKPILPANEAIAHLGFVNALHKQLLQYKAGQQGHTKPQTAPVEPQKALRQGIEAKGTEEPETGKMDDLESKIDQKLEILRKELKDSHKVEIDSLRKDIQDALENENEPTQ